MCTFWAARRLVEMTAESDYELRLPEFAKRLISEEIYEATVGTRSQIAQLSPGQEWGAVLDELRRQSAAFEPDAKAVRWFSACGPGGDSGCCSGRRIR